MDEEEDRPEWIHWLEGIPLSGLCLVFTACLAFTIVASIFKQLITVDPFLLLLLRNLVILALASISVAAYSFRPSRRAIMTEKMFGCSSKETGLLILRIVGSSSNAILTFYSIRFLPLGDVRVISCATPVFVTLLSRFFLKESCGLFEVLNVFFTVLGVIVVMQPPFLVSQFIDTELEESNKLTFHFDVALLALTGTVFAAITVTSTRALKEVDLFLLVFYNAFSGSLITVVITGVFGSYALVIDTTTALLILLMGCLSFYGQVAMTLSLKLDEAGSISITHKALSILFSFIAQIVYFDEIPSLASLFGAVIISSCVVMSGIRKIGDKKFKSAALRKVFCLSETNNSNAQENEYQSTPNAIT